ncbi:MAG: hypothetical protein C4341_01910 [Armatimonadota bacterium]
MNWLTIAVFVYSTLVIIGGVFGYVKAGSVPSLVASILAGGLLDVAAIISIRNETAGFSIAAVVTLALAAFFGYRLAQTGNLMPSVPALILSVLMLILLAVGHFLRRGAGA